VKVNLLEEFLYWKPPTGFPDDSIKAFVKFEAGGAHEDWGWCIERNGEVFAEHKYLDRCIKMAREKIKEQLDAKGKK
jgi:hypothetical protein